MSTIKPRKERSITDLINGLDIADGLKELLTSSSFTVRSLLNASESDFAVLGIDHYVGKLVRDAVKKVIRLEHSIVELKAWLAS